MIRFGGEAHHFQSRKEGSDRRQKEASRPPFAIYEKQIHSLLNLHSSNLDEIGDWEVEKDQLRRLTRQSIPGCKSESPVLLIERKLGSKEEEVGKVGRI
jgi:hypothetical protein